MLFSRSSWNEHEIEADAKELFSDAKKLVISKCAVKKKKTKILNARLKQNKHIVFRQMNYLLLLSLSKSLVIVIVPFMFIAVRV